MGVAASAVPPGTALMAIVGTGASAIGSSNVAVIVTALPDFPALAGEYVRAAVGGVVSTSTALVSGAVKVSGASLPAASLIVPPFNPIGEIAAMPSVSLSPGWTIYRNTSALVPLPER